MKKIKGIFGLVVLCSFFSFQLATGIVLEVILNEMYKNIKKDWQQGQDAREERQKQQQEKEKLRTKRSGGLSAVTKLETSFSDKAFMAAKITGLINKKLEIGGKDISLFPTPKLKIFVLQNIEDFLSLPKGYLLYKYVYEECMKQIRIEENNLERKTDEEGNVYFVDPNQQNKLIDEAYEKYIQDYGVTKENVKKYHNGVNWVKHKQSIVIKGLEDLIWQSVEEGEAFSVEDFAYQAHISILAYLIYLAGNKASMMSEAEHIEKATEVLAEQAYKKDKLSELRSLTDEQKKNIRLGSEQESEEQFQEKSKEVMTSLYDRMKNWLWLTKKQGIAQAQLPHEEKKRDAELSLTGESHEVPEFTEEELPQNMPTEEERQEYAKKIEKLYPIKPNAWDKFKASIWRLFGH